MGLFVTVRQTMHGMLEMFGCMDTGSPGRLSIGVKTNHLSHNRPLGAEQLAVIAGFPISAHSYCSASNYHLLEATVEVITCCKQEKSHRQTSRYNVLYMYMCMCMHW